MVTRDALKVPGGEQAVRPQLGLDSFRSGRV